MNYFSWNGNKLHWESFYSYISVLIFLLIVSSFLFTKNIIFNYFSTNERIGKISKINFYRSIGLCMLVVFFVRLGIFFGSGYPLYWEGLSLHVCRIHYLIIAFLLIANKLKYMKYILPISIWGALVAIIFGTHGSDFINNYQDILKDPKFSSLKLTDISENDYIQWWKSYKSANHFSGEVNGLELAAVKHHIFHYSSGPDNFIFQEFYFAHFVIVFIPMFVFCATNQKFAFADAWISISFYLVSSVIIFLMNYATSSAPVEWRMNNWYMAKDNINPQRNSIGILSRWPQNVVSMNVIGLSLMFVTHFIWIMQSKFVFFGQKNQKFSIIENNAWVVYKMSFVQNKVIQKLIPAIKN